MLDFLNFLRQKYSEKIGSRVRQGTVVDELAIKPTSLVMADFYNLLVEKQQRDNVDNWNIMTEEQLDAFGGKFFFPRVAGEKAFGVVRVWLNDFSDVVINDNFRASSADGLLFKANNSRRISKNSFKASTDTYGKYYFDIGVIAEYPGSEYNLSANGIQSISGVDFTYSYATNLSDMTPGSAHENNEQYANRLKYSINDRSLANKRSLYAGIKDKFPYVYSTYIAGAGDKYMVRDRLQAIDLSDPPKEAKYLGKISGDSIIKHTAYYAVYPGLAGTDPAAFNGPFSIYSDHKYPQTIEAVNLDSSDPAYHGYPLYQEATDDMYRGLYYDDYRNFMNVSTDDLFNIDDENVPLVPTVQPDDTWSIGFNGRPSGDYGSTGQDKTQIVNFNGSDITFKGGVKKTISVCKDINKRIGFKATGTITTPTNPESSSMQFVFGGPEYVNIDGTKIIDSFSGISFGVMISGALDETDTEATNAVAFFAHSSSLDSTVIFSNDMSSTITDNLGTLAEKPCRLALNAQYDFEYVFYDDLSMSLIISPRVINELLNDDILSYPANGSKGPLALDSGVLKYYQNAIYNQYSQQYGSMMKLSLSNKTSDTNSEWIVSRLKVVDIAPHRPTALYMFNVDNLEEPMSVVFRGSGLGAVGKVNKSGHSVYIWNIEKNGRISGDSILSSGGWQRLDGLSDPDGIKDSVSAPFVQQLSNMDRYIVTTRYGKVIVLMAVCEGQSMASIQAQGDRYNGDINAYLSVDYIKLQDVQIDTYKGNNKCDVYVSTVKNVDNLRLVTKEVSRGSSAYFTIDSDNGFEMPIATIDSIVDTNTGSTLLPSDYSIIRDNSSYINSSKDSFIISAPDFTDITIEYSTYNNISNIQDFFDGEEYRKIFGNILVKHKYPTFLDISINYYGTNTPDVLSNIIREYFDNNINLTFDIGSLSSFLYANKHVNYIQGSIVANYETLLDNGSTETGSVTASKTIRPIDLFRIRTLTLNQITTV